MAFSSTSRRARSIPEPGQVEAGPGPQEVRAVPGELGRIDDGQGLPAADVAAEVGRDGDDLARGQRRDVGRAVEVERKRAVEPCCEREDGLGGRGDLDPPFLLPLGGDDDMNVLVVMVVFVVRGGRLAVPPPAGEEAEGGGQCGDHHPAFHRLILP
jgi:hypothetical protein